MSQRLNANEHVHNPDIVSIQPYINLVLVGEVAVLLNERQCPLEDANNKKHYIQAHQLTPPDGIHVRNIENEQFRTFSYIEKYFTNEGRSGGKGVKSVTVGPNKSRIILFGDPASEFGLRSL